MNGTTTYNGSDAKQGQNTVTGGKSSAVFNTGTVYGTPGLGFNDRNQLDVGMNMNWDAENIKTLNEWIVECNKQQYIYDFVLDKILTKSKQINVVLLIICAVQSLINVANIGVGDNQNIYVVWSFKVLLGLLSAFSYIFTQYMILVKYDDTIKSYTAYLEGLNIFISDLTSTSDIKPSLRSDGDKYILDHKTMYNNIFQKSPFMNQSDWRDANAQYQIYLKNLDSGSVDYNGRRRQARAVVRYMMYAGVGAGVGDRDQTVHTFSVPEPQHEKKRILLPETVQITTRSINRPLGQKN